MWPRRFHVTLALWRLATAYGNALWYTRFRFKKDLNLPPGLQVTAQEWRRIRHYFMGVTYLTVLFECLIGRRKTKDEQTRIANLSALASFFDDLAQTHGAQHEGADYLQFGKQADPRRLAEHLLSGVKSGLPESSLNLFETSVNRVFEVELKEKKQPSDSDLKTLLDIAAQKGGCSVLLFRAVLIPAPGAAESAAIYQFGQLIQLSDDIFDVWFDQRDGVMTTARSCLLLGQVEALEFIFNNQYGVATQAFESLDIPRHRKALLLGALQVLFAITQVCIERYSQMHPLPLESRKEMVTDMARWKNRWRVVRHLWRVYAPQRRTE